MAVGMAAAVSTVAPLTLLVEAADSVAAALDPESRLASSLAQSLARALTTAVTGQATMTIHMPTITATTAVTMTGMPFATASSASRGHFSVARTAAGTSASNEIKKRPVGRFFKPPQEVILAQMKWPPDCGGFFRT
jgi:hypothetical protein